MVYCEVFCRRKEILEIKEMPNEEKHDKLYDIYLSEMAASYAFQKEQACM